MSAITSSSLLSPHAKSGKQALKSEHRQLLIESSKSCVLKSVNFEASVAGVMPDRKRWDYFIEISPDAYLHAVEVHQFDPSVLKQKKAGTREILREHSPETADLIRSWQVLLKGSLPRLDILARFTADTRIGVQRQLTVSNL